MRVTVIHSKPVGSTHAISALLVDELKKLNPRLIAAEYCIAGFKPCVGCFSCFKNGEETCPHYTDVHPIIAAIEESDILILDSPTYVMGMSGAMKSFLDHLAFRWYAHRPHPSMANKIGVAISTTAGMGAARVTKAMKSSFFGLTMAKYYKMSVRVMGFNWDDISPKIKRKITRRVHTTAVSVTKKCGRVKRSLFLRVVLRVMGIMHKRSASFPLDREWWQSHGWI